MLLYGNVDCAKKKERKVIFWSTISVPFIRPRPAGPVMDN